MMKPRFCPPNPAIGLGLIAAFGIVSIFATAARAQEYSQTRVPHLRPGAIGEPLSAMQPLQERSKSDSSEKKAARPKRAAAKAKKKAPVEKQTRRAPISFAGSAGLQAIYDDNILRASDPTILEFRMGTAPYKFKIDTYDDVIISPRIGLTFGRRLLGARETTLRVGYVGFQYARNGIKNNATWSFRLRQPTVGRDFVELNYSYAPFSYIRQLSDRAPFDPASSPLVWAPFKSTRTGFSLAYSKRLSDRVTLRTDGGRVLRYYNQRFMENDNWEWNGTGQATVSVTDAIKVIGQYQYSKVTARAVDTVGETRQGTNDGDPSYERDLYQAALDWSPQGKLPLADVVELTGQYQAYFYTSKLQYWDDPFHVGRKDRVYMIEVSATTAPVIGPATLEAGYRFSKRTSSATQEVDIADEKDYKDNRIWVGASYSF